MERLFSTVCYFLSHFCWSVNYLSPVSKFHIFFLTCSETEARCIFYIWGVLLLSFMESSIPVFQHFLKLFLIWSVNCWSHFFSPFLLVSKLYELNLWFKRCPGAFSIIYQKYDLYYLCLFRLFYGLQIVQFWSVNYASYFRPS